MWSKDLRTILEVMVRSRYGQAHNWKTQKEEYLLVEIRAIPQHKRYRTRTIHMISNTSCNDSLQSDSLQRSRYSWSSRATVIAVLHCCILASDMVFSARPIRLSWAAADAGIHPDAYRWLEVHLLVDCHTPIDHVSYLRPWHFHTTAHWWESSRPKDFISHLYIMSSQPVPVMWILYPLGRSMDGSYIFWAEQVVDVTQAILPV